MNTRESFIAGSEDGEVVESGSAGDSLLMEAFLSHSDNDRFTRIIVNRLWHRLMGRSIVHAVDAVDAGHGTKTSWIISRFASPRTDMI